MQFSQQNVSFVERSRMVQFDHVAWMYLLFSLVTLAGWHFRLKFENRPLLKTRCVMCVFLRSLLE